MTVIPVSAVLVDLELVFVHAIGSDAVEAQARHTVHVGGQDDAVPVNGGVLFQPVAYAQRHGVAFAPSQDWPWHGAVDGHGRTSCTRDVDGQFTDIQIEVRAAEHVRLARAGHGPDRRAPHAEPTQKSGSGQAFDERSSRGFALHAVASSQVDR